MIAYACWIVAPSRRSVASTISSRRHLQSFKCYMDLGNCTLPAVNNWRSMDSQHSHSRWSHTSQCLSWTSLPQFIDRSTHMCTWYSTRNRDPIRWKRNWTDSCMVRLALYVLTRILETKNLAGVPIFWTGLKYSTLSAIIKSGKRPWTLPLPPFSESVRTGHRISSHTFLQVLKQKKVGGLKGYGLLCGWCLDKFSVLSQSSGIGRFSPLII